MIEAYVRGMNSWAEPNPVNLSAVVGIIASVVIGAYCLVPPIQWMPIIIIAVVWVVLLSVARLAPVRKQMIEEKKENNRLNELNYYGRAALGAYNQLSEELKVQVPILTIEDVEQMSERDAEDLRDSLQALRLQYERQQDLLRRPHVESYLSSVHELTQSLAEGNRAILESSSK